MLPQSGFHLVPQASWPRPIVGESGHWAPFKAGVQADVRTAVTGVARREAPRYVHILRREQGSESSCDVIARYRALAALYTYHERVVLLTESDIMASD